MGDIKKVKVVNQAGPAGFVLFLAWIGAVVYFVGQVDGFWNIILAFLKSIIWPAIVTYEVFVRLGL